MKIKIPNLKNLKKKRWILGLVVVIILIAGFLVFDFNKKKNVSGVNCSKTISKDEAIQVVKELPEVQRFMNKVGWNSPAPQTISTPTIRFDGEDPDTFFIRVYEFVEQVDGTLKSTHTATFNLYKINKCTGKAICSQNDDEKCFDN